MAPRSFSAKDGVRENKHDGGQTRNVMETIFSRIEAVKTLLNLQSKSWKFLLTLDHLYLYTSESRFTDLSVREIKMRGSNHLFLTLFQI